MRYFSKIRVQVGLMTSLALLRFLIERVIVFTFGLIDLSIMEFKPNLLHSKIRKRELEREEDSPISFLLITLDILLIIIRYG